MAGRTTCPLCGSLAWPAADIAQLRSLWAAGLTGGQIAIKLGRKYTRSAVMGKVRRLGLCRSQQQIQTQKDRA